jgi:hypothetical protein
MADIDPSAADIRTMLTDQTRSMGESATKAAIGTFAPKI